MSGSPEDLEIGRLEAEVDELRQRAERAERILDALREPSAAVLMAAKLGMEESWPLRQVAIPADWYARALEDAVTAAEQEVDEDDQNDTEAEITAMADAAYERARLRAVTATEREVGA